MKFLILILLFLSACEDPIAYRCEPYKIEHYKWNNQLHQWDLDFLEMKNCK